MERSSDSKVSRVTVRSPMVAKPDRFAAEGRLADTGIGSRTDSFRSAWDRCIGEHRLDPSRRPEVPVLTQSEIKDRLSYVANFEILREELARVRSLVDCVGYSVTLADSAGLIIAEQPPSEHHRTTDRLGSLWQESKSGTSGIGTCLVEKSTTSVFHDEHFFKDFAEQACASVPLLSDEKQLLAVLNLSTNNRALSPATHRLTLQIAVDAIERLDERTFRATHRSEYIIRLLDNGLLPVLLAVNGDGYVVGANRHARTVLTLADSAIGSRSIWGVFERTPKLRTIGDLVRGEVSLRSLAARALFRAEVTPPPVALSSSLTSATPTTSPPTPSGTIGQPLDRWAGGDRALLRQVGMIRRMIGSGLPILALGETGVGKDTLARAIHAESSRSSQPFVAFNCAAVPETLIDSELFGYGSGAFTGAKKEGNPGRLVEANGGTLFLDEIGDMPGAQQTRLLRVLESGEVMPLAGLIHEGSFLRPASVA
jgi:transcriptional regulator of acetoin/glycerol metabolism